MIDAATPREITLRALLMAPDGKTRHIVHKTPAIQVSRTLR